MNIDEQELLTALSTTVIQSSKKPVFKLYYDADGKVITYTSENLPGTFIVITTEQFAEARADVLVRDGQIVYTHKQTHVFKLKKSATGRACSKYDVSIIDDSTDAIYWSQGAYEIK